MKRFTPPTRKFVVLLAAVVLVLSLAGLAEAQKHGNRSGGERPDREEMVTRMAAHLGLTDEQQEQLKQIHLAHLEETEALREQVKAAETRLDEIVDADTFDEGAIRAAAAEFAEAQTELYVSRAEMQQEIREILSPEQYEQLQEMHSRHGMKMRHSSGHRGGHSHHGDGQQPASEDG